MPPHAYIPGKTPRHPEGWFDAITQSVPKDALPDDLEATQAWAAGLAYFQAGYFWECHEVLEAVWMQTPEGSTERALVQAVIQLANARLKLKMDRPKATLKLCDIVHKHLLSFSGKTLILGLDPEMIANCCKQTEKSAKSQLD
jgi:hypothetical protein